MFDYGAGDGEFVGRRVGGGREESLEDFVLDSVFEVQKVSASACRYVLYVCPK